MKEKEIFLNFIFQKQEAYKNTKSKNVLNLINYAQKSPKNRD